MAAGMGTIQKKYESQQETLAQEADRKPERNPSQYENVSKRKETNDLKSKESPKEVVCFGCGQMGHMMKDKICPKNIKKRKRNLKTRKGSICMHTYRTEKFKEDIKEIDDSDEDNQLMNENSDDEDIIEDNNGESEDQEEDDPIKRIALPPHIPDWTLTGLQVVQLDAD